MIWYLSPCSLDLQHHSLADEEASWISSENIGFDTEVKGLHGSQDQRTQTEP